LDGTSSISLSKVRKLLEVLNLSSFNIVWRTHACLQSWDGLNIESLKVSG
jgi:hypothetical protein